MTKLADKIRGLSLRARMLALFGSLFAVTYVAGMLLTMYGLPFTDYRGDYALQQEEAFRNLNLIADLKKERLQRWIEERRDDVSVHAQSHHLFSDVRQLKATIRDQRRHSATDAKAWSKVKESSAYQHLFVQLTTLRFAYEEYGPVSIVDRATREVIVSSDVSELGKICDEPFIVDSEFFDQLDDTYVSDILYDGHLGMITMHFARLIQGEPTAEISEAPPSALLVIHVIPDEAIRPILHTGGGLGKTGEVLLVNRDRAILTRLKHTLADGSAAVPLEYRIDAAPATLAARGKEGLITSLDYRGEPVLAA